jgi:hypothetical protein
MSRRTPRWHDAAALAALLLLSLAIGSAGVAGGVSITSSLDGKKVLPHRIHWVAHPSVPASQVAEVKLVWIEQKPPYYYGQDGNWFVTAWLKPGLHRFTAEVGTKSGERALDTVTARTVAPPAAPKPLVGKWTRTVTAQEAGSGTPAGMWKLKIDGSGWQIWDPQNGRNYIDVAYMSGQRFQSRGGIWTNPKHSDGGNGWCEETNSPVNYTWSLSGGTLTVTLRGIDRCGDANAKQHFIWAGDWKRT